MHWVMRIMRRTRSAFATSLLLAACSSAPASLSGEVPDASATTSDVSPSHPDPGTSIPTTDAGATALDAASADAADGVDRCPDSFPRGAASEARLVQAFTPALEGVAVCPNGDVFVSQPDTAKIFRVPLDGSPPELWTTISGHQPLGMDCASDGALYAADFGSKDATVFRVAAKDDPGTPLPKIPGDSGYKAMNGVAAVKGVGVYATDATNTLNGRIVLFAEKSPNVFEASVAKGGLAFPNGVAFDPSATTLDLTLTLQSQVLAFPVATDGALGKQSVVSSGTPVVDAIDGLALAENNDRYVVHYLQGFVSRSSDGKKVASMKEPKSLAFRGGTLFITATAGLYAVDLAVCGVPR